ncbi:hypothetical protein FGO68_gene5722 [Halteria grandinella]|uniref:Uncharacterized protein n=1 Tax=Halteria grandinella TaxID=5974 RepID=A0A8J8NH06_HALGN|nr:hypothetical protein FGO68_gene5722 [Halteria grandinella]
MKLYSNPVSTIGCITYQQRYSPLYTRILPMVFVNLLDLIDNLSGNSKFGRNYECIFSLNQSKFLKKNVSPRLYQFIILARYRVSSSANSIICFTAFLEITEISSAGIQIIKFLFCLSPILKRDFLTYLQVKARLVNVKFAGRKSWIKVSTLRLTLYYCRFKGLFIYISFQQNQYCS